MLELAKSTVAGCSGEVITLTPVFVRWSGGAMVLGKLSVPGRPTIWITEGQGPSALAVVAGEFVWTFLLSSILSLPFLPSLGDSPIKTEILPQRVVKPKTNNQPTNPVFVFFFLLFLSIISSLFSSKTFVGVVG